jgi:Calx-beta domain
MRCDWLEGSLWMVVLPLLACDASPAPRADASAAEAEAGARPDDEESEAHDASAGRAADAAGRDASSEPDAGGVIASGSLSFSEAEGATWEGTGEWRVSLKLSAAAQRAETYTLMTSGTAESGADFKLDSTLVIAAGSSAAQVTIAIVDDSTREDSETLTLSIAGAAASARYTLHIADNDDERWPSDDAVTEVDAANAFPGANLSGLAYAPARAGMPADLWLVRNGPSQLYRLRASGATFSALTSDNWGAGKTLVFPGGAGAPDSEGLALAELGSPLLYVVSERDGNGPSAPTVLAYDTSASGTTLSAAHAWNLSNDLRTLMLEPNTGPEALTWVPDSYLTSAGFFDETVGAAYDPARYPDHAGGLFFVGIEQTGGIFAYALDHKSGTATRVASIVSGQMAMMALEFDRDTNYLWAWCDDTCGNHATILRVEENPSSPRKGRFGVRRSLSRPTSLANVNNEGMTIAPASECSGSKKAIFWVEDGTDAHVLRRGTIPCGAFLE